MSQLQIFSVVLLTLLLHSSQGLHAQQTAELETVASQKATSQSEGWRQLRGGDQAHADAQVEVPLKWSDTQSVIWKVKLPGKGWSSPVVDQGQIWLTTAIEPSRSLRAICLDEASGKVLHDVEVFRPDGLVPVHGRNGHATPTPLLDDQNVYVHFGTYGTAAVRRSDASILWKNQDTVIQHQWGPGSSPALMDDRLILNCDGMDLRYVVALDKSTGKQIWKTDRTAPTRDDGFFKKAFSTPTFAVVNGTPAVLSSGANQTTALRLEDGKELWSTRCFGYAGVTVPVVWKDLVFATSGYGDNQLQAVQISDQASGSAGEVVWSTKQGAPIIPTPIVVDDALYMISDNGRLSCLDAATGKVHWQQRLEGNFASSIVFVSGALLVSNDRGTTFVVRPSTEQCEILEKNQLDGNIQSTPAVSGDSLLIRTESNLYRIGEAKAGDKKWISLFDGQSFDGWRDFRGDTVSEESWQVQDGCLVSGKTPGDILTKETFANFELEFQWKVSSAANSGVFFRVTEDVRQIHESGLEYQVLDNVGQAGRPANEQAAASYGIFGPQRDVSRKVGEWNQGKIVVQGNRVEHYLNGQRVVEFEIGSPVYKQAVSQGPLRNHPKLAVQPKGHIALQNYHGHQAWFRNLRIRSLD